MARAQSYLLCIASFWSAIASLPAAIRFDTFTSTEGLNLVGDAAASGRALRLTPARTNQAGAVWLMEKQRVGFGFDTTFQFRLTEQGGLGHGADGFAFVLQNSGPSALGGRGSAGGFAVADPNYHDKEPGIPWSLAIFFDTYRNHEEKDPSANYIAFRTHGRPSELRWPPDRLALTPKLRVQLKDRKVHSARILFQPPVLSVFLDDSKAPVLSAAVDLFPVLDPQGTAWLGFTASTGGSYENHDILSWSLEAADVSSNMSMVSSEISFLLSACLPGRNLCTPDSTVVEPKGAGYHLILPANLEWGASIPNRGERSVVVTNAHGIACWDLKARGVAGCSGPDGKVSPAGPGFLAADAAAGALIMKNRQGHTWFSVNGPGGTAFKDNEGFYEFDLEIK